jgi:malate synthase
MSNRIEMNGLSVAEELYAFVRDEALPGTGLEEAAFWSSAASLIGEFSPQVRELLGTRDRLQQQIDDFHSSNGPAHPEVYEAFLRSIGYLADEPAAFTITTDRVDPEIATISGPQLVVPLLNARFAVNAANARWGSLYDALYGADVIDEAEGRERTGGYNPVRGAAVGGRG